MSSEEEASSMRDLACMLHSAFFGVFGALKDEYGFFGGCDYAIERINALNLYLKFIESKDVKEILRGLERTGIYQGLELRREGDAIFFTIGRCSFAGGEEGIHEKLRKIDVPCPLALFVGAYLAGRNPSRKIYVYPTVYDKEGCTTEMEILSLGQYEQKKKTLRGIAEAEKTIESRT